MLLVQPVEQAVGCGSIRLSKSCRREARGSASGTFGSAWGVVRWCVPSIFPITKAASSTFSSTDCEAHATVNALCTMMTPRTGRRTHGIVVQQYVLVLLPIIAHLVHLAHEYHLC